MDKKVYIYVTPFFPSLSSWRGAYCYDFVVALQRQFISKSVKRKVVVMTEGDGGDYEIGGVKVHTFKTRYLPSNIFPFLFKKFNQHSFLEKVKKVGEGEQWTSEDVVVCHGHTANYGIYCEAMKENSKCKTLLHHHDLQSFGLNNGMMRHCWLYNLIQFPILRRMHEQIDTHVFISEASRRSFLAAPDTSWTQYEEYKKQMRWLPYRPAKIKDSVILHNGVDKRVFNEGVGSRCRCTKEDCSFVIGCVGNFGEIKDQETLIRAVGLLDKPINVKFVGSGETLGRCKALAKEQEEKFRSTPTPKSYTFLSEMRHEELPDFYRSLDLFVLPSWFEGFGCVFTEANSCGVPFITCEGQGMDDLVPAEDRDRWLCKQKNSEDLSQKIRGVITLKSQVEAEEWKNIQKLSEDLDIDRLVSKFLTESRSLW